MGCVKYCRATGNADASRFCRPCFRMAGFCRSSSRHTIGPNICSHKSEFRRSVHSFKCIEREAPYWVAFGRHPLAAAVVLPLQRAALCHVTTACHIDATPRAFTSKHTFPKADVIEGDIVGGRWAYRLRSVVVAICACSRSVRLCCFSHCCRRLGRFQQFHALSVEIL